MRNPRIVPLAALAVGLSACPASDHAGNDRESELDAPEAAAEFADASSALAGVAAGTLKPQAMTDADRRNVPADAGRCVFRFTEVGQPIVTYGVSAVVKLNGSLVTLPATGEDQYGADRVSLSLRPLEDARRGETFEAEFVLRLADAPHERGHHGFVECEPGAGPADADR